jgi:hypothetical protein
MARARNIKPGFFKNYDLADLGPIAQLLFAGLWCLADKEGRLEDKPRLIKAEVFPYYDADVNGELTKLERLGFVSRYSAGGVDVIFIREFKKHQSPHHTERASELPAEPEKKLSAPLPVRTPETHGEATVKSPLENGGNPPDSPIPDSLIPDSPIADEKPEPNGSVDSDAEAPGVDLLGAEFGKVTAETGESDNAALHCPISRIISAYHELMPLNPRVKIVNDKRRKSISARWREAAKLDFEPFGYSTVRRGLEAWRTFFSVCAESDFLTGKAKAQPGKPPFLADIDFLMSPEGFAKCFENKYHREVKE